MPRMTARGTERRRQRSSNAEQALALWLEAARRRAELGSVALADSVGMLVAGAGPARECDELAAWAPILHRGEPGPVSRSLAAAKVPGFDAFVCAEDPRTPARALLDELAAGCSRILSARC